MPGPCSRPNGSKAEWDEDNILVCSVHRDQYGLFLAPCEFTSKSVDKCDAPVVTYRMYQESRGRLVTGKTQASRRR